MSPSAHLFFERILGRLLGEDGFTISRNFFSIKMIQSTLLLGKGGVNPNLVRCLRKVGRLSRLKSLFNMSLIHI
mgnify:CR=1 FL=1